MKLSMVGLLGAALSLGACATAGDRRGERDEEAVVRIEGRSGEQLTGTGTFRRVGPNVVLRVRVANAPPGAHGIHLHQVGDCSAADASSAGDHWNPTGALHGLLDGVPAHLGDIGNLIVDPDGRGVLEFATDQWTIGTGRPDDVLGRALIIHANVDDLVTQPTGNAGGRIGCGVVRRPGGEPVALADAPGFRSRR